jgi:Uma2 family endonuclease
MAAQEEVRQPMTLEEWRALEQTSHDVKHEYIDGHVYAMAGGSLAHSRIGINVVRALEDALGEGPCRVYNSDAAARLSPRRYTYPDATVTCDAQDRPTTENMEVTAPRVIVEVLSDSTEAYDRGRKFGYYRACAHVHEYVLIASTYQAVEVYRRTGAGWTAYVSYGPGDTVELQSIAVRIPLATLYRLSEVAVLAEPEGEV